MHSPDPDDPLAGRAVGRDPGAPAAAPRRSSNAFGSPGTDSTVRRLDLNDAFIKHPDATFIMRAAGNAMHGAGIADGDVLLVDRALAAGHGSVVVAVVEGELVCRRLEQTAGTRGRAAGRTQLVAADALVAPIVIGPESPLEVWGVVTTVIRSLA